MGSAILKSRHCPIRSSLPPSRGIMLILTLGTSLRERHFDGYDILRQESSEIQ